MNAIELIMLENDILAVGIEDKANHVFVELNNEIGVSQTISYLQSKGLYEEAAISFVVDRSANVENTAFGGESISFRASPTTISRGTIGSWAICNITGQLGIITNEHVAPLGTSMDYRGHYNPTTGNFSRNVALGTTLRAQNGGTVDAAFVPFAMQADWTITPYGRYDTTSYKNVRLGNNNHIVSGYPIFRIGQTTGTTTGEIKSANVSVTVDGIRKTNTFRFSNPPEGGDSGGPVYYNDGVNLHLIGLTFARGSVFLGGTQGWACHITNVA